MHDAFKVYTVIEKLPQKIEAIYAQGDKLYVGTLYGTLLVYSVREPQGLDDAISVTLLETLKLFKKAIEQINYIKTLGAIVILSDTAITLHELGTYRLVETLTKGAYLFSLYSNIEVQDDSVPQVITRLAVAVRRKVIVYTWQDSQGLVPKEFPVPERVRRMEWVRSQTLCIGFDNEYALLDYKTGVLTTLCSLNTPLNQGALGSTLETTLNTLHTFSNLATGGLMGLVGSKPGKPLITRLPKDEILLVKEGLDGKPKWNNGIEWSGTPEELGYSNPYAVAILPRHVEIRNVETKALVQSAELPHAHFLAQGQGKLLYIASTTEVWRLIPNNFQQQVDELVQKEEYEEAISLIRQVDPVLLRDNVAVQVETLYAHHLFRKRHYEEALSIFKDLDLPATDVIALYPPVISGHLHADTTEGSSPPDSVKTAQSESSTKNTQSITMTPKELEEAVGCLMRFLEEKRIWVEQDMRKAESSVSLEQDEKIQNALKMLDIVDTALLKSYMVAGGPQVGALLRNVNYCNLEETESLLIKHKKNRELVDFYKGKGQHRKALEHLKAIHSAPGEMHGVLPTVHYLQDLGPEHLKLILEFGTWILESEPSVAMKIFTDERSEVTVLPRHKIISYLERLSLDLCVVYLEHIIHDLRDQTPEFHNTLLISYLSQIQRDSTGPDNESAASQDAVQETRAKMLDFLNESTFYKAERILSRLPVDGCYEERAILLSRIGQHDQALNIYVHKLNNFQAAEEYCIKNFNSLDTSKNVYLMLLKVYLKPPNREKPMLEPALDILARHGTNIDPTSVLGLLPTTTRVDQLYKFFEKSIRESNKTKHMDMIVKNLLKAEQLQTQEQLMYYRSRRVKITEDRMCPKCNKRIGNRWCRGALLLQGNYGLDGCLAQRLVRDVKVQ
ncbi:Vam6/Vps39-like protein [Mortierella sp. NVP85]|nr:Vam6/Vps39-like protein [Mortierella sp. NVP85]